MTTPSEMHIMLDEIAKSVDTAKWAPQFPDAARLKPIDPFASYIARIGDWRILVMKCATGDDFASYAYDGAATKEGIFLRLTRPLAERCFRLASTKETP